MACAQSDTIPRERGSARSSAARLARGVAYCVFALSFGFAAAVILGLLA